MSMPTQASLSEFEQLVLLALARLGERAYGEKRRNTRLRKIGDRHVVLARHEQDVAGKQRAMIEECHRFTIIKHDVGGLFPGNNPAKSTALVTHRHLPFLARSRATVTVDSAR